MSTSAIAVSLAIMLHETFHFLTSVLLGANPSGITAFELLGNFDGLTPAGLIALGVSGSVANLLLLLVGWLILTKRALSSSSGLAAWYLFSFNGMLITTKMMGESIFGFGDWITVAQNMPDAMVFRGAVLLISAIGIVLMVRLSGKYLVFLLPYSDTRSRVVRAIRIIIVGALTSAVLVLVAALLRPIGTERDILLAFGAGVAPFVPLMFVARVVARSKHTGEVIGDRIGWILTLAAFLCAMIFWIGFGRGIST
jgi:hypothetical protein